MTWDADKIRREYKRIYPDATPEDLERAEARRPASGDAVRSRGRVRWDIIRAAFAVLFLLATLWDLKWK